MCRFMNIHFLRSETRCLSQDKENKVYGQISGCESQEILFVLEDVAEGSFRNGLLRLADFLAAFHVIH